MRAMVIPHFGGPEVFEQREVEKPAPGVGQVLVRVVASGTNPVDAKLRANGTWAGLTPPVILGYDVAGVVAEVGPGVTQFQPGDAVYYPPEIFGNQAGSYAEYNVAPVAIIAPKPGNLSFVEAAAVPLAGGTAWEALFRRLELRVGETVLIHGGAGGVGSFVVASGTNPVDAKLRANGTWAGLTPPVILGYDVAGVVAEVGPGVTHFQPGDSVYYTPEIFGNQAGSYAEYNVAPVAIVAPKPGNLSFVEAAAVPLAGGTAWEALFRRLELRVGETVLIHGGAGGVGSFAVQIARAAGARVLATAGPANQEVLGNLGADVAIDYTREDPAEVALRETGGQGVDAVFDTAGGEVVAHSLRAVRPFGRLACVLAPEGDLSLLYQRNLTLHGVFLTRERKRLEEMTRLIERGQMRPLVEEVLPLEEVARAHRRLDSGHGRGKIVLRVAEE